MKGLEGNMLDMAVSKQFGSWKLDVGFKTSSPRTVIWGPSGAGKTLTLKLIAGLVKPDSGHIRVNDRTLFDSETKTNQPPQLRRVGLVFQNYALFPHLSVEQNLGFALKRDASVKAKVFEMADMLEISHLLGRYPSQLSGGQCQRVAIGRALLARPELLLLDEPFSALDSDLRVRLRYELAELLEVAGLPSVMVTHDPDDVRIFGQEVVVLRDGKGSPCRQTRRSSIESHPSALGKVPGWVPARPRAGSLISSYSPDDPGSSSFAKGDQTWLQRN